MLTPFNKSAEKVAFCRDSARAIWIRLALNRTIWKRDRCMSFWQGSVKLGRKERVTSTTCICPGLWLVQQVARITSVVKPTATWEITVSWLTLFLVRNVSNVGFSLWRVRQQDTADEPTDRAERSVTGALQQVNNLQVCGRTKQLNSCTWNRRRCRMTTFFVKKRAFKRYNASFG